MDAIGKMQHRKRIDIGIVVALDDVEVRRDKKCRGRGPAGEEQDALSLREKFMAIRPA